MHFEDIYKGKERNEAIICTGFLAANAVSGMIIMLTNLMVCTFCSAIANNITGTVKDVVLTYVGFFFFTDVNKSLPVLGGIGLSFLGASIYIFDAYKKQKK